MAKGDKRRIAENAQFLWRFRSGILISNALYVIVKLLLKSATCTRFNYGAFALSSVLLYVTHGGLKHALEPAYDSSGQLIFAGSDLSKGGVISYYQDVAYLCMFALSLGAFTNYAWLVMLCIPLYAGFMLYRYVVGPWLRHRGSSHEDVVDAGSDAAAKKRLAKNERRRARMEKFSVRR